MHHHHLSIIICREEECLIVIVCCLLSLCFIFFIFPLSTITTNNREPVSPIQFYVVSTSTKSSKYTAALYSVSYILRLSTHTNTARSRHHRHLSISQRRRLYSDSSGRPLSFVVVMMNEYDVDRNERTLAVFRKEVIYYVWRL